MIMKSQSTTKFPLKIVDVQKCYGAKVVLNGVTLELARGSITGLLGRNGSGKTTLLRSCVGLLKPERGSVQLFECEAWDSPSDIRHRVGYVPQSFSDLGWLTVGEALALVGSFYENWDHSLVSRFTREWEVPVGERIGNLSHGQQQKVAILLAIGHCPELLVLDEPVASLDPVARHEFLRALLLLNEEFKQTILFSSHITTDIERVAADLAILDNGKIIYHGGLDDLKEQIQCLFLKADCSFKEDSVDGFISKRIDGNRMQVWVRDWDDEKSERLTRELGLPIHIESVGLEELFMGMTS